MPSNSSLIALELVAQHCWWCLHAVRRLHSSLSAVDTIDVDLEDGDSSSHGTFDSHQGLSSGDEQPHLAFAGWEWDSEQESSFFL